MNKEITIHTHINRGNQVWYAIFSINFMKSSITLMECMKRKCWAEWQNSIMTQRVAKCRLLNTMEKLLGILPSSKEESIRRSYVGLVLTVTYKDKVWEINC